MQDNFFKLVDPSQQRANRSNSSIKWVLEEGFLNEEQFLNLTQGQVFVLDKSNNSIHPLVKYFLDAKILKIDQILQLTYRDLCFEMRPLLVDVLVDGEGFYKMDNKGIFKIINYLRDKGMETGIPTLKDLTSFYLKENNFFTEKNKQNNPEEVFQISEDTSAFKMKFGSLEGNCGGH